MIAVKKTPGEKSFDVILYLFMLVLLVLTLYPFWTQVIISMDGGGAKSTAYASGLVLYPAKFTLESYKLAFHYDALWYGYKNTVVRTVLGVALAVVFTSITAFPLAKKDLPMNRIFTGIILFTMLFGGGLIPSYLLIKGLGMYNTIWALVVPGMISAFNVLIIRNFFRSLPEELEESARVDGAGYLRIFLQIVIPLSKPVLATIALWVAVGHWNAWFDSLIYISDPNHQVLQVILRKIIIDNNTSGLMLAQQNLTHHSEFSGRQLQATMIMFSIIPMLVIYPFVQKYFVTGVMVGAVKG
ncbi:MULTISPECIES: carbohydrate ABC transporter permease [Paenibacillus]|uniref:Carbohydrate ABC transporter permease n=1 Tax=Paenibacillus lignilyticus TaxID=1172615 RepID=A0ABS5CA95_9BACL|nr:carbohydrate ABC transporter permease [Paenibacillus sp. BC26]MBP3962920.1 carbohydrate ABC transporter permease [Paenibacillus lignilyticus]SFT10201.1 putative aldouronate transport system permease protein [Paenibacillus sp. BC26]